jgi:hypothetical protein
VTAQLIQEILEQLPPPQAAALQSQPGFLAQISGVVSSAADYAQLLGTAAGPLEQSAAETAIGLIAAAQAAGEIGPGLAAEATAAAGATTAGIGAIIVLTLATILAVLTGDSSSGTSEAAELAQLGQAIQNIQQEQLATYWQTNRQGIMSNWDSPTGGLGTDLDNLVSEGTGGKDVKAGAADYHNHGLAFVNSLVPQLTPEATAQIYWERPVVEDQDLELGTVPYPHQGPPPQGSWSAGLIITGWFGTLPQPAPGPALGGDPSQMVLDPTSTLPFLLIGIESYLTLESVANVIDPSLPTLKDYVTEFESDLTAYASFLESQFQLLATGIGKTQLPAAGDITGFLWFISVVVNGDEFLNPGLYWGGSAPDITVQVPSSGSLWNGVYGAADAYPVYGDYNTTMPIAVGTKTPSCLVDLVNTESMVADFQPVFSSPTNQEEIIRLWTVPWVQNRIILGTLARWKAIFLLKGGDHVWAVIQNLRALAGQAPLPNPTLADGSLASGNWSMRELAGALVQGGWLGYFEGLQGVGDISVARMLGFIDELARGNWGAPVQETTQPMSFRDRLAAVALAV